MDLLVTNANVLTMDGRDTPASPTRSAIAIHAGKIVAVGRDQDVAAFRRPAMRVIDAGGRTVLPGFIEPHNHMVGYGTALIGVDARTPPNETIADLVTRLRQAAAASPSHRWILGRGYDDTGLRDMRHPTRRDLDRASTEHPIVIWHNSGHLLVANSKALAIAGITATTADPPGGRIGRLEGSAEPDGVLYEAPAQTMVSRLIPAYEPAELAAAFARAQDEFLRHGVTTIHDAHVSRLRGLDIHDTYRRMHAEGALKLRVNMFMQWDYLKELDFAPSTSRPSSTTWSSPSTGAATRSRSTPTATRPSTPSSSRTGGRFRRSPGPTTATGSSTARCAIPASSSRSVGSG